MNLLPTQQKIKQQLKGPGTSMLVGNILMTNMRQTSIFYLTQLTMLTNQMVTIQVYGPISKWTISKDNAGHCERSATKFHT